MINRKHKILSILKTIIEILLFVLVANIFMSIILYKKIFSRLDNTFPFEMSYLDKNYDNIIKEDISFVSNGNTLKGCIYKNDNEKCNGIIIVSSGLVSDIDRHYPETVYFVEKDWWVLNYNKTGILNSEGNSLYGFDQNITDLLAAIDYISNCPNAINKKVVIYSHSSGAYAAIASLQFRHNISGVVAISSFDSSIEFMCYYAEKYAGPISILGKFIINCYQKIVFNDYYAINTIDILNKTNTRVLIIEGNEDEIVDKKNRLSNYKISNSFVSMKIIDEEYRNRHCTVWLSKDGGRYYGDTIIEMYSKKNILIDKKLINELDNNFMEQVNNFLLLSIRE